MCNCKRTFEEVKNVALRFQKTIGKKIAIHNTFNKYDFCEYAYAKNKGYKIIGVIDENNFYNIYKNE